MARTTTKTQDQTDTTPPQAPADNLPVATSRNNGVKAIVPASWQEITAIAGAICRAKMAPKSYCDQQGSPFPDKVAVAIMHGMEVGMTPMASLQSIAVINGMPSLFGDGMLAVVRASGLLEDIVEEEEDWDKHGPVAAICKVKRKGEKTWGIQRVCRDDAVKAGWWDKAGPWKLTPHRMLQMRARGWALRDKFADVLRGLHSAEEMLDMVDVTPQGSATTGAVPDEPKREDFTDNKAEATKPQPTGQAETAMAPAKGGAPSNAAQPEKLKDTLPPKKEEPKKAATDVQDLNETTDQPGDPRDQEETDVPTDPKPQIDKSNLDEEEDSAPIKFTNYSKYSAFFEFADPWLCDESRTEAEIVAFGAFYNQYMTRGCDPKVEPNKKVRDAMEDTKRVYKEALEFAQKRAASR